MGVSLEMGMAFYLCLVNAIGFFLMGLDKWKAKRHKWRVAEKTLFGIGMIGGSLGCWLGMYAFRHKTKHWYFVVGMPLILAVQVLFILFLTFEMQQAIMT